MSPTTGSARLTSACARVARMLVALFALLAGAGAVRAQEPARQRVWLVPRSDTVFVFLAVPRTTGGFVVYRSPVGAAAAARLRSAAPIEPVREPAQVAGMLGSDRAMAMRAVRATDEDEMYRRMTHDRFAGDILASVSRNAALALGRLFVDTGVTRGGEYDYRVVFTDFRGKETDSSVTERVRVVDTPPAAPAGIKVDVNDAEARVGWSYPKYRGDPRDFVVGFHVYRADTPTGPFRRLDVAPVLRNDAAPLEFDDADVRNGGAYRYRVTAVDVVGRESAPLLSATVAVKDRTPPSSPTDVVVQEGTGVVSLSWRIAGEPDVAGYHVERANSLGDRFRRLDATLIPAQHPEYADTVAGGRRYFYRVLAVDASGNTSEPTNAYSAVPHDKSPPDAPTNVVATASPTGHRVIVRWSASKAKDLRGYNVYRAGSADKLVKLTDAPITGTQFVDSGYSSRGLRPGGGYVIEVSAVDSSRNESPRVRTEIHIVDDEPPGAPSTLSTENVEGRYVQIRWSPSSALDVAAYELTRAGGDSARRLGRFDAKARDLRDTTVVRGVRYVYRLVAIDSAGNRSIPAVDSLQFRDFVPPPAPRVAAARATPAGVVVTWQRVIAADLAGYNVYRSNLPTGVFQRVGTVPAATLTFTDPQGKAGLYYHIKAVDRSGNESRHSPVADVVPQ